MEMRARYGDFGCDIKISEDLGGMCVVGEGFGETDTHADERWENWYKGVGGWWVGALSDMVGWGEIVSWCMIGMGMGEQVFEKSR